MVELLDRIIIERLGDDSIHIRYEDKDVMYRHGELEDVEDIENAIIGALKSFFDESEEWNENRRKG